MRVQEARRQFAPMKKLLRELNIDYAMLYPARLRVNKQGRSHIFTDPKALQKALKDKEQRHSPERHLLDEAAGGVPGRAGLNAGGHLQTISTGELDTFWGLLQACICLSTNDCGKF